MLLIKYSQPNDVEKVPFGARGSQQAVQAFVPLLEERGVSKEAEDWRQRLVEFGREIPAEGSFRLSHALRKVWIDQALLQTKLLAEGCWRKTSKMSWNMRSMLSPLIWAAQLAATSGILKCRVKASHPDIFQRCLVPGNPEEHAGADSRLKV